MFNSKLYELVSLYKLKHLFFSVSALLQHVKTVDGEILQTLLPRARELTQRCSKGLLYSEQVKTAITHW